MRRTFLLIAVLMLSIAGFSVDLIYSSAYLNLPLSSELDALGGVSNSLPMGILSFGQNPASIDTAGEFCFLVSQVYDIMGSRQNGIAIGYKHGIFDGGVYGFYSSVDEIEARTAPTDQPDYLFTARQMYLGLNAAVSPTENFTIGTALKVINETIDLEKMDALAWDVGAVGRVYGFAIGLSVRNLGEKVTFKEALYGLPLTYSLGVSRNWRFITAEAYYNKPDIRSADYGFAAQFDVNKWLSFRSGLRLNHDSRLFSAGTTFNYEGFSLSYSFVPLRNQLGTRHAISLSYGIIN